MSVLDDLGTLLQNSGLGVIDQTIFLGRVPDGQLVSGVSVPDALIALVEYGGTAPGMTHNSTGFADETPYIQFVSRGDRNDYQIARALAGTAWRMFGQIRDAYIGSARYLWIRPLQSPFLINRDVNDRPWIGFNMQVKKTPS